MKRLLLALAAVALTSTLAACGPHELDGEQRIKAELGARQTASASDADLVSCSGQDSDNDGYVTCSIKDRKSPHAISELLCSYKAPGCKRKL